MIINIVDAIVVPEISITGDDTPTVSIASDSSTVNITLTDGVGTIPTGNIDGGTFN